MRVFVTGGTGFVGGAVVPLLLERGHELLLLTRCTLAAGGNAARGVKCVQGDLARPEGWQAALQAFRPEALVHLAWEGLPDYSLEPCRRNLDHGVRLFALAVEAGCSCLLATGSCWEYAGRHGALAESAPIGADSFFPAAKSALRLMGQAFAGDGTVRFYWPRLFFVYGPGQRSDALIPHVIRSIQDNRRPQVATPGNKHDFIFVQDAARAIVAVLEQRPPGSIYNVGTGRAFSVAEVIRTTYRVMGHSFDEAILRENGDGQQNYWADPSRLNADVEWRPACDLISGITQTVQAIKR